MTDPQWKEQLETTLPYVPDPKNFKRRKKLPIPKTRFLIDKIFKTMNKTKKKRQLLVPGMKIKVIKGKPVLKNI